MSVGTSPAARRGNTDHVARRGRRSRQPKRTGTWCPGSWCPPLRSAAPDRKSFARVTRAVRVVQAPGSHLFSGAVARLPRIQPRREFPVTGGDRAEYSDASPAPLCRRRGFCQALTVSWRSGMGAVWDHQRPDRHAISRLYDGHLWRHYRKEALLVLTCSLSPPGPKCRKRCLEEGAFGLYAALRHVVAVRKRSRSRVSRKRPMSPW